MHHTLRIPEILANIFSDFSNLSPTELRSEPCDRDLASLARTCRLFKEPALDVLWQALPNSSPLARCLPNASYYDSKRQVYSFLRPLTQTEWDTLQSYTRRIRSIRNFNARIDWVSVKTFFTPPTTGPLFPSLRELDCIYTEHTITLLRLPLPSLVYLSATLEDSHLYLDSLTSLPETSPEIRVLGLCARPPDDAFDKFFSSCVPRWRNLQELTCRETTLDTDALSHMPALTELELNWCTPLLVPDSTPLFPSLNEISFQSESLQPLLRLLDRAQLPAITIFNAIIADCLLEDVTFFLAGLSTSNATHTLTTLRLDQRDSYGDDSSSNSRPLGFADLHSCAAFSNLRHLEINIECYVDLTENQLLTLASAWPKLEHFTINQDYGWGSDAGITPGGLIQLLQTCRSLAWICLVLNTQGYTEVPLPHVPSSLALTFPNLYIIDVVDSRIEGESVAALTTFFSGIAACSREDFSIAYGVPEVIFDEEYTERWRDVYNQVNDALGRSESTDSGVSCGSSEQEVDETP